MTKKQGLSIACAAWAYIWLYALELGLRYF